MMNRSLWLSLAVAGWIAGMGFVAGCSAPEGSGSGKSGDAAGGTAPDQAQSEKVNSGKSGNNAEKADKPSKQATAKSEDVEAAKKRLEAIGPKARFKLPSAGLLTEIVIQDGSGITAEDITLFGKLTDLEKLQIFNCRTLNDDVTNQLGGLQNLTSLALTNSVINDPTVEWIVKTFPNLTELDLSSNTNLSNSVLKVISELTKLQRLSLVQNRFNDLGTRRIAKLENLRSLDLRGNMEAADMTLEVVAGLPKLNAFKHRSTAVTDSGLEQLAKNATLESLLIQDFAITDQSGPHLAKIAKLTQLEVFRCPAFGTQGVLALKGMPLTRLTLRDLPNVNDQAMEVLTELPALKKLYLHEIASLSDAGLKNLASLKSLELLDLWSLPQVTDATIDVIASLPNLKELSIRTTGVTDAAVEKLLAMQTLESLTFKENGAVSAEATQKLAGRKWKKLDVGAGGASDSDSQ